MRLMKPCAKSLERRLVEVLAAPSKIFMTFSGGGDTKEMKLE